MVARPTNRADIAGSFDDREATMKRLAMQPAFASFVFFLTGVTYAEAPMYSVRLLPIPAACDSYSYWHGLRQNGTALGILTCDDRPDPTAVVWGDSGFSELPTLGGPSAMPYGSGNQGLVVGAAETPEMYDSDFHVLRPVVWDAGTVRDLGTLGGPLGAATAINSMGTIVGVSQPRDEDPSIGLRSIRACAWDRGSIIDLGDLGGPESVAYDVNDRGWIVGSSTTGIPLGSWYEEHAFLYDGRAMRDLGTLGGPFSLAWAINAAGEVVGYSYPPRSPASDTLSWHAFVWRDGTMLDLGTLGGSFSQALDINDRGDIVGWSRLGIPANHAVLWRRDRIIDLNEATSKPTECVLIRASAITNRGEILVDAICGGRERVAILTPRDRSGAEYP
jgi:probable HAF family extracellular repeat protein